MAVRYINKQIIMAQIQACRTIILGIQRHVGQLSEVFQWKGNHPTVSEGELLRSAQLCSSLKNDIANLERVISELRPKETDGMQLIIKEAPVETRFSDLSFEELRVKIKAWCDERNWEQYHSPRNLVMAMIGEVGELSELLPGELSPGLTELDAQQKHHVSEECADVLHNLVRFCDRAQIDLVQAILQKMIKNSKKYPIQQVKGSNLKYDQYNKE